MVFRTRGGDKRDRTADLLNAIQALSQLSYTPIFGSLSDSFCIIAQPRDLSRVFDDFFLKISIQEEKRFSFSRSSHTIHSTPCMCLVFCCNNMIPYIVAVLHFISQKPAKKGFPIDVNFQQRIILFHSQRRRTPPCCPWIAYPHRLAGPSTASPSVVHLDLCLVRLALQPSFAKYR